MKELKFKYYQILKRLGFKIPKYVILEHAKLLYIDKYSIHGMCYVITKDLKCYNIDNFPKQIFNKFNYNFCEGKLISMTVDSYQSYWWDASNTKDRIKAFDKLIKYYKEHKEYI